MQIESRGKIYDATNKPQSEKIAYFTSLRKLMSGTILSGFQLGSKKHGIDSTIKICRSRDDGESWVELPFQFQTELDGIPGSLASAEMCQVESGRVLLFATWFDRSDPERPLFDPQTEGLLHSRQLLAISTDEGDSWSPWQTIPTPGLTGTAATGPVTSWPDGTLAFALESFKEFDDPTPARHAAWLLLSRDGGRSFSAPYRVAQDPKNLVYYWDQRLCVAGPPDRYLALFWTHDRESQRDLNVHLLEGSISEDPQRLPRATSIPGQIAAPLLLEDGRWLAFVVDRGRPGTMTLWQSLDQGQTWPADRRLVVHEHEELAKVSQGQENIDFKEYWEDMGKWSFGHPALIPLKSGQVLLAHYAGTPDRMSTHWIRVSV